MTRLIALVVKDLRGLGRSPLMLAVLIGYPVLVSLLVAGALQTQQQRPAVAVVSLDAPGRTVQVGERRVSVDDYVARLGDELDVRRVADTATAMRELDSGRVAAVVTIPDGFIGDLQSGVRQPVVRLVTSRRSPVEGTAIERRLEAAVFRFNQGLAQGYVEQVVRLVDFISNGGDVGVFGRRGSLIGLTRSRGIVLGLQGELRAAGNLGAARELDALLEFIDETQRNLDLARPAATAISSPIRLDVARAADGRAPLSAFGTAGALLVSVALAAILLGAAGLAAEREDQAIVRLRIGRVPLWNVLAAKVVVAAVSSLLIGMVLLIAVAAFTDLAVGRWTWWAAALVVAGAAFGALGTLVGALVRETRSAILVSLMVGLPLAFTVFVPDRLVSDVASVIPFGPAFDAFRTLLGDAEPSGVPGALAALAVMAAVQAAVAARLLSRRER
ncbi:MAG: ABC transporter permease [Thermoleophilia bacterium]